MAKRIKIKSITEVSSCAKGINPLANTVLAKAKPSSVFEEPVVKGIFEDMLKKNEINEMFWNMRYAMDDAISEIFYDNDIAMEDKASKIKEVVSSYSTVVDQLLTNVAKSKEKESLEMGNDKDTNFTQEQLDAAIAKAVEEAMSKGQPEVERLTKIAAMTAVEKGHYDILKGDDQTAFLNATSEERGKIIEKSKKTDETFTTPDGVIVSKAEVGDVAYAVLKSQQASIARAQQEAAMEKAKREESELIHKAESTYANLPGEPSTKAAILKSLETIKDESVRKSAEELLSAANVAFGQLFQAVSTPESSVSNLQIVKSNVGFSKSADDAALELDQKADTLVAKEGISKAEAYSRLLRDPECVELAKAAKQTKATG